MKLYYAPLACSLAAHIACREAGLDVELVRVDLPTKRTEAGGDLFAQNPMGQVPTLLLPGGRVLTENVAVLSYLADRTPDETPEAAAESSDRYELTRWLAFISTELHKRVLWPIFSPITPEAVKAYARESALGLDVVAARLESRDVLVGRSFTVADAFLFWALTLMPHAGVPLEGHPALLRYRALHRKRPSVHAALSFEKAAFEKPFAA